MLVNNIIRIGQIQWIIVCEMILNPEGQIFHSTCTHRINEFLNSQKGFFMHHIVINPETHNCLRYREQEAIDCLSVNKVLISHLCLPRFMHHFRRGCGKFVRASGSGWPPENRIFQTAGQLLIWIRSNDDSMVMSYASSIQTKFQHRHGEVCLGWQNVWGHSQLWLENWRKILEGT